LEVGTFNDYFNAVARYGTTLCLPKDITGFYAENEIPLPEKVQKGCARLFRYLKGVLRPDERILNGYPYSEFIDGFNEAKTAAGSLSENIAHDVTPSEMKRWVAGLAPEYGTFFLMLAYSGARLEQLYTVLKETTHEDRIKIAETVIPDEENGLSRPVFRLNVKAFGSERKHTEYYYFPVEFRDVVLSYVPTFSLDKFKKDTTTAETEGKQNAKRITPKTLRKWNTNLMIRGGVPAEVAGWIEGRVPNKHNSAAAVTWSKYADLDQLAAAAYSQIEPTIVTWLPIDTSFGENAPQIKEKPKRADPPRKTPKEKLPPAPRKAQISDEKIERVLQLYDEGVSIRDISKTTKTGRVTIAKLVKERSGK